jgi:hypothetical protein
MWDLSRDVEGNPRLSSIYLLCHVWLRVLTSYHHVKFDELWTSDSCATLGKRSLGKGASSYRADKERADKERAT